MGAIGAWATACERPPVQVADERVHMLGDHVFNDEHAAVLSGSAPQGVDGRPRLALPPVTRVDSNVG